MGLEGVPAQDLASDRQHHDSQIKPDRPILDIRQIASDPVLDLLDGPGFASPSVYLRPPGDPRLHPVTESILGDNVAEQLVVRLGVGRMRARSYQGHVALEYVQQLRQLVEAQGAQPFTQPRDSRVPARRLPVTQQICHSMMHGAKLVAGKKSIIETEAGLPE